MAEFVELNNPFVKLNFNHADFYGFALIEHGPTAIQTEIKIRPLQGISDCFPVLTDQSIVFHLFPLNLESYFKYPNVIKELIFNNIMRDPLKILIKTLGLLALRCFSDNINLDLNLTSIYVGGYDHLRLKGIILKGAVDDFKEWKEKLLAMYKKIGDACFLSPGKTDWEYEKFTELLRGSRSPREVESLLHSVLFWTKYKRMNVICKFEDMVKVCPLTFRKYVEVANRWVLDEWQSRILLDPKGRAFMCNFVAKNIYAETSLYHSPQEVDNLLLFLRYPLGHFDEASSGSYFPSPYEVLTYFDYEFPRMMYEVYKGCVAMHESQTFNFELDNM